MARNVQLEILCEHCVIGAFRGSPPDFLVLSGNASGKPLVGYRGKSLCLGSPVYQTIVASDGSVHSFHICIPRLLLDRFSPLDDRRQEILSCS